MAFSFPNIEIVSLGRQTKREATNENKWSTTTVDDSYALDQQKR